MNNIPTSPSPAHNYVAWMWAVAIAAEAPYQPPDLSWKYPDVERWAEKLGRKWMAQWVEEVAQERSKVLKNYYELIKRVYQFDSSSFLGEKYPCPMDLLKAIATQLFEEYEELRPFPEEFPGRKSFVDGGRACTAFLKGDLVENPLGPSPPGEFPILLNDLKYWSRMPHKMLNEWAKRLSQHDWELEDLLEEVIRDNKRVTNEVKKMAPWGKAGRKSKRKQRF
jgi:hypothetical protein